MAVMMENEIRSNVLNSQELQGSGMKVLNMTATWDGRL